MPTQDQTQAYTLALNSVNDQIATLQSTASSLISTITGTGLSAAAAAQALADERDQIAAVWATGDPNDSGRAMAAMVALAAGTSDAVKQAQLALNPVGAVGDAIAGSGSDLLGIAIVGVLIYLLVEHEEGGRL
jgi:hypothetical protein